MRVYVDVKEEEAPTDDVPSYSNNIEEQISKRRSMADQFPSEEHIMVVVRNKRPQKPDGNPHTAAKIRRLDPP